MFKFDINSSMYMILLLTFLIVAISFIAAALKSFNEHRYNDGVGLTSVQIGCLDKKLIIENYICFQKYDMWRFSTFI